MRAMTICALTSTGLLCAAASCAVQEPSDAAAPLAESASAASASAIDICHPRDGEPPLRLHLTGKPAQAHLAHGDFLPFNAWPDADGDGFGAEGAAAESVCALPAGYAANQGDCDDADPAVHQDDPTSTHDDQCLPWDASDVSAHLAGVDGVAASSTYGASLCTVTAAMKSGRTTWLQLVCAHQQGAQHEPIIDILIGSEVLALPAALSPGNAVLLYTFWYIPDDDDTPGKAFVLKRPADGKLLLAYTEHFTPGPGISQIGLTPADWYAPLTVQVTTGLCPLVPDYCNVRRTRAALELSAPGADPARVLDHRRGHVGSQYGVHVGKLERPTSYACVDTPPYTSFVIYALDPPCGEPAAEACNGMDDDGDGGVDEGNPGGGAPCFWSADDACAVGVTACAGGALLCEPPTAGDAVELECQAGRCDTGQPGRCAFGMWGWSWSGRSCNRLAGPIAERCNGADDDCDGEIDEACVQPPPEGCLSYGIGVCATGTTSFVDGSTACIPNQPSAEVCDELDNDCDGETDEGDVCACMEEWCEGEGW